MDVIFDIETDGFRYSRVHCLVAAVIETGELFKFASAPGHLPIADGIALLEAADNLIGHNILTFDAPCLRKLYNANLPKEKLFDTLTAVRMLWPDIRDADLASGKLPANLIGKHSLAAWGHRLGEYKGKFSDFTHFSPEMVAYCVQDVIASWTLYQHVLEAAPEC